MTEFPYRIIDVDNHYYEPDDAFTRHLDPAFADRAYRIVRTDGGPGVPYFGDTPAYYLTSTPVDLIGRPGVHAPDKDNRYRPLDAVDLVRPGEIPWFVDRDARLEWMDDQAIESTLMWPSLGLTVEWQLRDDRAACVANLRSFNRWLDETWGFDYQHRIFGVPWLTLVDLDEAVRELDYVLAHGARVVHLLFTPVNGRTVAHPHHDPFWARLAEAEVPVAFHGAEAGYCDLFSDAFGELRRPPAHQQSAFQRAAFWERPIMDALASLVLHNLFGRFPSLQAMSVENGSAWVPYLLRVMDKAEKTGAYGNWLGGRITDHPSAIFTRHVSVAPNDDDDIRGLVDLIGADRVLLGSDYPHPEGFPEPRRFLDGHDLTESEVRLVARDNAVKLLRLA
ncbi:MAG TPA: amidohydrolase family protein [Acidimicrobiales bacterium]|jgi:predicted TIM-barrel fold metal-dependent hydrolase|nr:amidohydrolase family protein [Acidimicrobiales bacterium]